MTIRRASWIERRGSMSDRGASLLVVLGVLIFVGLTVTLLFAFAQTGLKSGSQLSALERNRLAAANAMQAAEGYLALGANCGASGSTLVTVNTVPVTCSGSTFGVAGNGDTSGTGLLNLSYGWANSVILNDPNTSLVQNDTNAGPGGTFLVQGNFAAAGQLEISGNGDNFGAAKCAMTAGVFPSAVMTTPGCVQTVVYPGTMTYRSPNVAQTWASAGPVIATNPTLPTIPMPTQLPSTSSVFNGSVGAAATGTIPNGSASCVALPTKNYVGSTSYMIVLSPGYWTASTLNGFTGGSPKVGASNCYFLQNSTIALVILEPGYYYLGMDQNWVIKGNSALGGTRVIAGYYGGPTGDQPSSTNPINTAARLACDTPSTQVANGSNTGVLLTVGNSVASAMRNGIVVADSKYGNQIGISNALQVCGGFNSAMASAGVEPISVYGYNGFAANAWSSTHATTTSYTLGSVVRPSTGNGFVYEATTAGVSSANEPTSITAAAGTWSPSTTYALNAAVSPATSNGYLYKVTTAGKSGGTTPVWSTTLNAKVSDGTVTWTNVGTSTIWPLTIGGTLVDGTATWTNIGPNAPLLFNQSSATWTASKSQNTGDVVAPATANGFLYQATTAGTTRATAPTSVTTAPGTWIKSTAYALGTILAPATSNGYLYSVTTAGKSSTSSPTWPTTVGKTVTDGTVTWTNIGSSTIWPLTVGASVTDGTVTWQNIGTSNIGTLYAPSSPCSAQSIDLGKLATSGSSTNCALLADPLASSGNPTNGTIGLQGAVYAPSDSLGLALHIQGSGTGGVLITYGVDLYGLNVLQEGSPTQLPVGDCVDNDETSSGQNFCGTSPPAAWQPSIAVPVSTGMTLSATAGSVTATATVSVANGKTTVLTFREQ